MVTRHGACKLSRTKNRYPPDAWGEGKSPPRDEHPPAMTCSILGVRRLQFSLPTECIADFRLAGTFLKNQCLRLHSGAADSEKEKETEMHRLSGCAFGINLAMNRKGRKEHGEGRGQPSHRHPGPASQRVPRAPAAGSYLVFLSPPLLLRHLQPRRPCYGASVHRRMFSPASLTSAPQMPAL